MAEVSACRLKLGWFGSKSGQLVQRHEYGGMGAGKRWRTKNEESKEGKRRKIKREDHKAQNTPF